MSAYQYGQSSPLTAKSMGDELNDVSGLHDERDLRCYHAASGQQGTRRNPVDCDSNEYLQSEVQLGYQFQEKKIHIQPRPVR